MAAKKETVPESIKKGIEAIARGLGVAAIELWTIFVRQYVVKGITWAFTGIVLLIMAAFLWQFIHLFVLIPICGAIALFYGAIMYIGNPKYYALQDITEKLDDVFTKVKGGAEPVAQKPKSRLSDPGGYLYF